jgi:hypothetical protein
VAAPLFAKITEAALRRLAVSPEVPERTLRAATPAGDVLARFVSQTSAPEPGQAPLDGVMPDLVGLTAREAAVSAARRGLMVHLEGSGAVVAQEPLAGALVEPGQACLLRLQPTWVASSGGAAP